ncbi:MAG: hypothetical protein PHY16_16015 [Methylobacter sp.]|nr:hypothetical protein [Methylobacter sp.]
MSKNLLVFILSILNITGGLLLTVGSVHFEKSAVMPGVTDSAMEDGARHELYFHAAALMTQGKKEDKGDITTPIGKAAINDKTLSVNEQTVKL